MAEIKPRYEFRIWGQNLAELRQRLEQLAAPSRTETSEEIYLIPAVTDKCNAKIRNDLMDIKILVATERGLEQWRPVLKAEFPLDRSLIAAQVFSALELAPPQMSREQYAMNEFLDEVINAEPKIAVVTVSKSRVRLALGECQAEFATTTIGDQARDTVAVESTDPDAVARVTQQLGIEGMPNTSYIRQIKQLLGPRSA